MTIRTATDANFEEMVKSGTVLVDFWASWCGPCRMLAPVIDDLNQELGSQLTIVKLNVDEYGQLAAKFEVMSLPTMILFKDGKQVEKIIGYQSKRALHDLIKPYL
jgi:thioredoxin 1